MTPMNAPTSALERLSEDDLHRGIDRLLGDLDRLDLVLGMPDQAL
jgi:hypothetical protein